MRVALEVKDEKWCLQMDEEIDVVECNNKWQWLDLSKGA